MPGAEAATQSRRRSAAKTAAKGGTEPSGGWRRTPVTVTSKAASRRAIWVPMAPAPTMQAAVRASERPAGSPSAWLEAIRSFGEAPRQREEEGHGVLGDGH